MAEHIFERLACERGITVEEMRAITSARIGKGWNDPDPKKRAQWRRIPCKGELPTPDVLRNIETCYSICYNLKRGGVLEMGFGMIIKKIRSQLKMTQEQFARELDISFSTINRWENGHTVPSKLAKVRLLEFCKNQNVDINLISELEKL